MQGKEFLFGSPEATQLRELFPEAYILIRENTGNYPHTWLIDDPNKQTINLPDSQYTFADVRRVQREHPNCHVLLVRDAFNPRKATAQGH